VNKPGIDFFDVDHTITRGSTGRLFLLEAVSRRIMRPWHLAVIPLNFLAYRFGKGGVAFFKREFPIIKGIPRKDLEEMAQRVFEERIEGDIRPGIRALIAERKAAGARLVLASSSLDFIIEPLARQLGADAVIASSLEFEDGISTGRLLGMPAFGPLKRDRARAFAAEAGLGLPDCAFYSDSIHDLPLLLEVGSPVVVNPERRLAREAARRGWLSLAF
jgi:HAD superfamily hydrolase (TIGR01490 family)